MSKPSQERLKIGELLTDTEGALRCANEAVSAAIKERDELTAQHDLLTGLLDFKPKPANKRKAKPEQPGVSFAPSGVPSKLSTAKRKAKPAVSNEIALDVDAVLPGENEEGKLLQAETDRKEEDAIAIDEWAAEAVAKAEKTVKEGKDIDNTPVN